jgi:hypothetical protein
LSRREQAEPFRYRDVLGPLMCLIGASCLFAGVLVDLGGGTAKALMLAAVLLFVPGAYITLALVRRVAGSPR